MRKREVVVRVWLYGEEAGFAVIDVTYGEVKVEIKKVERVVVCILGCVGQLCCH